MEHKQRVLWVHVDPPSQQEIEHLQNNGFVVCESNLAYTIAKHYQTLCDEELEKTGKVPVLPSELYELLLHEVEQTDTMFIVGKNLLHNTLVLLRIQNTPKSSEET